jgi:hypothetical protein
MHAGAAVRSTGTCVILDASDAQGRGLLVFANPMQIGMEAIASFGVGEVGAPVFR